MSPEDNGINSDDSGGSYVPGTGVWTVGALTTGSNAVLTLTATVDAGTAGTTITNVITDVSQNEHDTGDTPDDLTATVTVSLPTDVDLLVRKTVSDETPVEGQVIIYTLSVTNNGPANATGVYLTDVLPAGVTYVSDTPSQGTYDDVTGVWTVGALAAASVAAGTATSAAVHPPAKNETSEATMIARTSAISRSPSP